MFNADRHIAKLWHDADPQAYKTKRLLYTVLERAVLDATSTSRITDYAIKTNKRDMSSAKEWLFDVVDDETPPPFSCSWVCLHLDVDHNTLIKRIREFIDNRNKVAKSQSKGMLNLIESVFEESDIEAPILRRGVYTYGRSHRCEYERSEKGTES